MICLKAAHFNKKSIIFRAKTFQLPTWQWQYSPNTSQGKLLLSLCMYLLLLLLLPMQCWCGERSRASIHYIFNRLVCSYLATTYIQLHMRYRFWSGRAFAVWQCYNQTYTACRWWRTNFFWTSTEQRLQHFIRNQYK